MYAGRPQNLWGSGGLDILKPQMKKEADMNNNFCIRVILAALLLAGFQFNPARAAESVTVTDAMGRKVTVRQPVERLAFSATCLGEALLILGLWDRVKARGHMIHPDPNLYPGIDNIPAIAVNKPGPYNINYETLLALDMDALVTINVPFKGFKRIDSKIKSRFPVVTLEMFTPKSYEWNFTILGQIFDTAEKAQAYIDWAREIIQGISRRTAKLEPKQKIRYFMKWSFGNAEDFTTISDRFNGMPDLNRILGAINVAGEIPRIWGGPVDPEWLMQQKIDVIVCQDRIHKGYGIAMDTPAIVIKHRKKVMALPVFAASEAVARGRVYMISPQYMFAPGFVVYLAYLAKWFHPDLFMDLDPDAVHQTYLTRFIGAPPEMARKAVFVYPR